MSKRIDEVDVASSYWDIGVDVAGKSGYDSTWDTLPPTEAFNKKNREAEQQQLFNSRYFDSLLSPETQKAPSLAVVPSKKTEQNTFYDVIVPATDTTQTSMLGGTTHKDKSLLQGSFIDVVVPYSAPFDPEDYAMAKAKEPLQVAIKEEPKAPMPVDIKFDIAPPSAMNKPVLESPKLTAKAASKSLSIFNRFVDWVSNLFSKKEEPQKAQTTQEQDYSPTESQGKLENPAQRNAEAIRDCLKKLNASLEKMRDLVQNDTTAGSTTDVELSMMFLMLIDAVKRQCDYKKNELVAINTELVDSQKKMKEYQAKYFEALDKKLSLNWISKGASVGGYLATGLAIGGFGLAAAMVIATLATGGVAAVVGGFATIAALFAIPQAFSAGIKGVSQMVKSGVEYKTDQHQGSMIEFRGKQDAILFTNQIHMEDLREILTNINKTWELMSKISAEQYSTMSSFRQN